MQGFERAAVCLKRLSDAFAKMASSFARRPVRHFQTDAGKSIKKQCSFLSDKVSEPVWTPSKCHCLTGGVSLGRASPDTQTDDVKNTVSEDQ